MLRLKQIQNHLTMSTASDELLKEYIYFGHDTVNRLSFLRDDVDFIEQALNHPTTRILVFSEGGVYGTIDNATKFVSVHFATKEDLGVSLIDDWISYNKTSDLKINDLFLTTFLGLDERKDGLKYKEYSGTAYFAADITNFAVLKEKFSSIDGISLIRERGDVFRLSNFDSTLFSHGKMYLDWLSRNRFCAGCGSKTLPIHAGTKLMCSSVKEDSCPVKNAPVSNISFPRTDSVIITAITNDKYDKMLLGRGKRFPLPMYSTIAGFVEPGETIEVAALREVWEETGVKAHELQILKTQPWPYPANLMIGCIAFVKENGINEIINLGHDPELADAQWFDTKEIRDILAKKVKKDWILPPSTAIAHHLIDHVVKKFEEQHKHQL